jgi:N-acetylglucosaminyl-diphospho-decaprenol L-rhamnosyltransferase
MWPEPASQPPEQLRRACRFRRPTVTVCVVNWNCRELLRKCLRSLSPRRQGRGVEVIVVDNGSADGAADMVARDFPRVRLIRNAANRGFSAANNQAAALARGKYLFFLNNDTVVPPGTLRRLRDYLRSHPEVGLVGPRLRDGRGRPQVSARCQPTVGALLHRVALLRRTGLFRAAYRRYRGRGGDFNSTRAVEVLMGAAMFCRRSVFRECGPWDEGYTFGGEDIDLCARIGRRFRVVYHPAVEVTHFGRASSRRHIGYAHVNTVAGITRFLRRNGTPTAALFAYKAAVTLDAPIQWLSHLVQYLWRSLRGRHAKAAKSRLALQAAGHFLTQGLIPLWRA